MNASKQPYYIVFCLPNNKNLLIISIYKKVTIQHPFIAGFKITLETDLMAFEKSWNFNIIDTSIWKKVFVWVKKEQAKQIIDQLPEYKITKILYLLKDIQNDDEIEDELFCENLAEKYLNSSNHEMISF